MFKRSRKKNNNSGSAQAQLYTSNPPRRRRRRGVGMRLARGLLGIVLFVVCAGLAVGVALLVAKDRFETAGPLKAEKVINIARGSGTTEIAKQLESAGVISDARLFQGGVLYNQVQNELKAGEYAFPAGVSMAGVMDLLVEGKSITYKVSIPEGFTSQQAIERLSGAEVLTGEVAAVPPEGTLLPDTYVYERGATRADIVRQMQVAQRKTIADLWPNRAEGLPLKTAREAVILASIVEKETGVAKERPRVAAVFLNRLEKGMRLQSDPTIIYGIVGGKGKMDRPISKKDIQRRTRYNTYQINGLPPTPISNPGKESIKAVLNPVQSEDLYFVADGSGGHAFAKTLDEHEANVRKWREIEEARKAAEEAKKREEEARRKAEEREKLVKAFEEGTLPKPEENDLRAIAAAAEKVEEAGYVTLAMVEELASDTQPLPRIKPSPPQ